MNSPLAETPGKEPQPAQNHLPYHTNFSPNPKVVETSFSDTPAQAALGGLIRITKLQVGMRREPGFLFYWEGNQPRKFRRTSEQEKETGISFPPEWG